MKVSASLPDEDDAFLTSYAQTHGLTRSATLHHAVLALRDQGLSDDYAQAYAEWERSGDAAAWDIVSGDGL